MCHFLDPTLNVRRAYKRYSNAERGYEKIKIAEMQALLLKKIEELTLYVIELKKENEFLKISKQDKNQ